jgi:hypothetical protein
MNPKLTVYSAVAFVAVSLCSAGVASAQGSSGAPASTATPAPTILDRAYDGKFHWTVTPYVWLPTVNGNLQYQTPALGRLGATGGTAQLNIQAGPNSYLSHLNFAAMGAVEVRKGNVDVFGDYINVNGSTGSTYVASVYSPLGKFAVPLNLATSSHLSSTIWDLQAGYTVAHGSDADVELFGGYRAFPVTSTLSYDINIGSKAQISRVGGLERVDSLNDWIWGVRGKALFGSDRKWFVPYYFDTGMGWNNNTMQYYTGVGRVFRTQALIFGWRSLQYNTANGAPSNALVQRLRFDGPLIGYSFLL